MSDIDTGTSSIGQANTRFAPFSKRRCAESGTGYGKGSIFTAAKLDVDWPPNSYWYLDQITCKSDKDPSTLPSIAKVNQTTSSVI